MDTKKYLPDIPFPRRETYSTYYFYQGGEVVCKIIGSEVGLAAAMEMYPNAVKETVVDDAPFKQARLDYAKEEKKLMEQFKDDCFAAVGLTKNQFTGALWDVAWDRGHSGGLHDVFSVFQDLAGLDKLARLTYHNPTGN